MNALSNFCFSSQLTTEEKKVFFQKGINLIEKENAYILVSNGHWVRLQFSGELNENAKKYQQKVKELFYECLKELI